MMEYKSIDTYEHPLLFYNVATLSKSVHSLWCSHPGIIGLAPLSVSVHSPNGDTYISQLNFLSPSQFNFCFNFYLCYKNDEMGAINMF